MSFHSRSAQQHQAHDSGFVHPLSSEITPRAAYEGRRDLFKLMATGAAGAALASWARARGLGAGRAPQQAGALPGASRRWPAP
jgi:sulfoxide reductase catalytic subunit YedY